ncbi:FliC/FljB family flagellin [[Erwinia] mediterraneensis]|uniref:FliC/FljB family flagellin n=1 Tax=[Erwinia] mediterraneensis TaxID=2161819 RepID=UPI0010300980|nr:FliC/FljB family flagellin [[Erwinia] mediterraneensis]
MTQVINTNSLSLVTQNNMNKSQSAMSTAIERLSSGLRINSAKDDAAGQAIANRFTANINGLTQAARNANDGISIAQTTEGSLSEINNNLQRIRELTVQAQNGTNSESDLNSIQDEITSRLNEIDRVSGQTQFNGVKVLASDNTLKIQVGANDGETVSIDLKKITSETLGLDGFNVNGKVAVDNAKASEADLTAAGFTQGTVDANGNSDWTKTTTTTHNAATAANVLSKISDNSTISYAGTDTGLGLAATTDYKYDSATQSYTFDVVGAVATSGAAATALKGYLGTGDNLATIDIGGSKQEVNIAKDGTITDTNGDALYIDSTGNLTKNKAGLNATNLATVDSLFDKTRTGTQDATVEFVSGMSAHFDAAADTVDFTGASISADAMATALNGKAYSVAIGAESYQVAAGGAVTTPAGGATAVFTDADGALTTNATSIKVDTYHEFANGNIYDDKGAALYKAADGSLTTEATGESEVTKDPLAALDAAISSIDEFRSSLGAIQNRLDSAVTNLNNTTTNLAAAQSRIQDADYAVEVSNMSKAQIVQQAGNSVLAKANQVPQQILSLLQG